MLDNFIPVWPNDPENHSKIRCIACGDDDIKIVEVKINNICRPDEIISYSRCNHCNSLIASGSNFFDYTDSEGKKPAYWRYYVQIGAGIDSMIDPIDQLRSDDVEKRLLDVGCGFGFTLDYWEKSGSGSATGLEPSDYGEIGKDMLGVDIIPEYLSRDGVICNNEYDIIYSSEVIEHVDNPIDFLETIKLKLKKNGIIALTTPNSGYIHPSSNMNAVVAALSPGLHRVLFSRFALEKILKSVGFSNIEVQTKEERLIAFASDEKLQFKSDPEKRFQRYSEYISRGSLNTSLDKDIRIGFSFRAAKEFVNYGKIEEASIHIRIFRELCLSMYGLDIDRPYKIPQYFLDVKDMSSFAEKYPFCLSAFLYYRGIYEVHKFNFEIAELYFSVAIDCIKHNLEISHVYFQEAASLLWLARFELANAVLSSGRPSVAANLFKELKRDIHAPQGVYKFAVILPDLHARIELQLGIALLQSRRFEPAIDAFRRAISLCDKDSFIMQKSNELIVEAEICINS
jgi:2-polyprenyl-3-methyl-5-hydroxy-6-metoxy-1,4-benzoquinol methylase